MQTTAPFTVKESKKTVTYYVVEITRPGAEDVILEKRFREFDEFHHKLKKRLSNLPHFPSKSMVSLKEDADIDKRRYKLENYMQELCSYPDIMNLDITKRFLQLGTNGAVIPPKLISTLENLILGVRDFHYQEDERLLFIGLSDVNVASRVDSYLTNIKLPWQKDKSKKGAVVGAVECYIQNGTHDNFKFEKLWIKPFHKQVINIYWDQASCLLLIGRDDGKITILKVASELNYSKFDEVVTNKLHHGRVMGVFIDSISEFVYSIGEDKRFVAYNLLKNDMIAEFTCGDALLTSMVPDKENKRVFISNRSGQVYIYDIGSVTPKSVHILQAYSKGVIRGICYDSYRNYLLSANYDDGIIDVIDIQKPDRVKQSQISTQIKGNKKVRSILMSTSRGEIYTGSEDGMITVWDARKTTSIYQMKAHSLGVTKLQFLNNTNILLSGGKDSKLKIYRVPDEWTEGGLDGEGSKFRSSVLERYSKSIDMHPSGILDDSDDEIDGDYKGGWSKDM